MIRFSNYTEEIKPFSLSDFVIEMRGGAPLTPEDILESGDYKIIPKKAVQQGGKLIIGDDCNYVTSAVYDKWGNSHIDKSYLIVVLRDLVPSGPNIGYIVENDSVDKGILAQGVYGLKIKNELSGRYLIQYSNTPQYRKLMHSIMTGSTQVHIRNETFLNIHIFIPCLEEQRKIADLLFTLDQIIERTQSEIDAWEKQKRGVMQLLFSRKVRFKADDRSEFPEWEEKSLGEIFDVITDYVAAGSFADIAKNVKYLSSGFAQLVRTVDLKNGFTSKDPVYIDENAYKYLWRVWLNREGIILPNVGNCGEVYYFIPEDLPYEHSALAPNAILVRSATENNQFMAYRMKAPDFQNKLKLIVSPSGQTKFNKTEFKGLTITIPSFAEQNKIAACLSGFDDVIDKTKKELEAYRELKKGLLQQMFI